MRRFENAAVEARFDQEPAAQRKRLLALRELIFDVADASEVVGELGESLKWGEPSYAPARARVGSPIRLGSAGEDDVALFFNCNTLLVEGFRSRFGEQLRYSKNRAVLLNVADPMPTELVRECVKDALTYHWRKRHA